MDDSTPSEANSGRKELRLDAVTLPASVLALLVAMLLTMGTPPVSTVGLVVAGLSVVSVLVGSVALLVGLTKRFA